MNKKLPPPCHPKPKQTDLGDSLEDFFLFVLAAA
jgi:hypothetical protein